VEAVRRLNEAGIPCGVLVAPVLPGLSDGTDQLREVVEACVAAGAVSISAIPLHLRTGVREHYLGWLAAARPDLAGLYAPRFEGPKGPRAYQPKAVQEELSERVRRIVRSAEQHRASSGPVQFVESASGDMRQRLAEQGVGDAAPSPAAPPPPSLPPPAEQLAFMV
jgi:DNA repair photolyase